MLRSDRFPYVQLLVTTGTWQFIESAYVDTGVEGGLLIPSYLRHEILAHAEDIALAVADGAVIYAPSWSGYVEFDDASFRTEIAAMGHRFLLGRDVIDKLNICFERGRSVSIEF